MNFNLLILFDLSNYLFFSWKESKSEAVQLLQNAR